MEILEGVCYYDTKAQKYFQVIEISEEEGFFEVVQINTESNISSYSSIAESAELRISQVEEYLQEERCRKIAYKLEDLYFEAMKKIDKNNYQKRECIFVKIDKDGELYQKNVTLYTSLFTGNTYNLEERELPFFGKRKRKFKILENPDIFAVSYSLIGDDADSYRQLSCNAEVARIFNYTGELMYCIPDRQKKLSKKELAILTENNKRRWEVSVNHDERSIVEQILKDEYEMEVDIQELYHLSLSDVSKEELEIFTNDGITTTYNYKYLSEPTTTDVINRVIASNQKEWDNYVNTLIERYSEKRKPVSIK